MDATYIVTSYVVIDDVLELIGHTDDTRTRVSRAEVLTVAIVAAKYFQNHHERALCLLQQTGYLPNQTECVAFQSPLARLARHLAADRQLVGRDDGHGQCLCD